MSNSDQQQASQPAAAQPRARDRSRLGWRPLLAALWPELLALALISAAFSVLPALGLVWLSQQGWLVYWFTLIAVLIGLLALLRLLRRGDASRIWCPTAGPAAAAAERDARSAIAQLAAGANADDLASREALDALLNRTVTAVATAYAPGDQTALLNFTLPEALLMLEEVSRRLRVMLSVELPVLRHLRLSWAAKGGGLIGQGLAPARGLATAWRLVRWSDPLGALIAEARSFVIERGVSLLGRETRALAAAVLVREVGGVAIELYSGSYRRRVDPQAAYAVTDAPPARALRVLVIGQRNSGKSSLINALLGKNAALIGATQTTTEWTAYPVFGEQPLSDDNRGFDSAFATGAGWWELVDSPPLTVRADAQWRKQARDADLVIWVAAAHRADRGLDQRALKSLRALADADPGLRPLPLTVALTHADRLEPALEWNPPYDPLAAKGPKDISMAQALHAAASAFAMPPEQIVLIALRTSSDHWNLDVLREQLARLWPDARQKSLERARSSEGVLKAGIDLFRSVPGAIKRAGHFWRR